MPKTKDRKPNGYWTLERCQESALKYKRRTEWSKGDNVAYQTARRNGWIDACCGHMKKSFASQIIGVYSNLKTRQLCNTGRVRKPRGYWTRERIEAFAREFEGTGEEFSRTGAGSAADRLGILAEMSRLRPNFGKTLNTDGMKKMAYEVPASKVCRFCDEDTPYHRLVNSKNILCGKMNVCKRCYSHIKKGKLRKPAPWNNSKAMAAVYALRDRMNALPDKLATALFGDCVFEVDHIYPRNGATVSGLHVHNNLRVTTRKENAAKSNLVP